MRRCVHSDFGRSCNAAAKLKVEDYLWVPKTLSAPSSTRFGGLSRTLPRVGLRVQTQRG